MTSRSQAQRDRLYGSGLCRKAGSTFDAPTAARALGAAGVEHRLGKRAAPRRDQPKRAPRGRPRTGPAGASP